MTAQSRKTTTKIKRKARPGARAESAATRAASIGGSGLEGFAVHVGDDKRDAQASMRELRETAAAPRARARNANLLPTQQLDPETAARSYLDAALASRELASFERPAMAGIAAEFGSLGTESVPLTGTMMVKFRQTFNKIPVYGSYVTVELDRHNKCVGINSSMGTPTGAPSIAKVAPARALAVAAKAAA